MKKIILFLAVVSLILGGINVASSTNFKTNALISEKINMETQMHGTLVEHGGPGIFDFELREMLEANIGDNYESMILTFTQCYGGDFIDDFQDTRDTTILTGNPACKVTYYGGYHRGIAQSLDLGESTSDAHSAAETSNPHPREDPQHVGESREIGGSESTHVLVWAGDPGGPAGNSDQDDINDIHEEFDNPGENSHVTVLSGDGTGANVDGPATRDDLVSALAEIGSQMNENEQFILFVTDHGNKEATEDNQVINPGENPFEIIIPNEVYDDWNYCDDNEPVVILEFFGPGSDPFDGFIVLNDVDYVEYVKYIVDINGDEIIDYTQYVYDIKAEPWPGTNLLVVYSHSYDELAARLLGIGSGNINRPYPPESLEINGPNKGIPGTFYDYEFSNCIDPEGDDMTYHVEWGDGDIDEGTVESGGNFTLSHSWQNKGDYTIKAKLIDTFGSESDWTTLDIIIPRNKISINTIIKRLLERFLNMFPLTELR